MLSPVSAAVVSTTSKVISVSGKYDGSISYTVPAGKTFTGNLIAYGNSGQTGITINGVSVVINPTTSYGFGLVIPVTFPAGTVLSGGANQYNWTLIGNES